MTERVLTAGVSSWRLGSPAVSSRHCSAAETVPGCRDSEPPSHRLPDRWGHGTRLWRLEPDAAPDECCLGVLRSAGSREGEHFCQTVRERRGLSHLSWVTGLLGPESPRSALECCRGPVCRPRLSSPPGSGWSRHGETGSRENAAAGASGVATSSVGVSGRAGRRRACVAHVRSQRGSGHAPRPSARRPAIRTRAPR